MSKITPTDIQQQQFKVKFRGFDIREVDGYLEKTATVLETLLDENEKLRGKTERLNLENQGYKKREEIFKRAILNSQKVLEQMKQNAQKTAERIIAEAEVNAERILNRAHGRLAQLHEDIAELKRQRMQIEVQIRSILETHTKLLDMGKEESKDADDEDLKVKLLNRI
ncbi:MAG: DivIVA domain-containing protein [Deltaproteobacteria bacterium]|nr:DivIVA domain-containing protein [Deltaproteobacteria bacterium]MBW2218446.1 DivIVA domain-containing protein [Deltaproteobacteria bacterium]